MVASDTQDQVVVLAPVDVDPRSWFSNERTCIEWLHSAGILAAFASGLIASGESPMRLAGIGLMVPALLVVLHAARMHHVRATQLDNRAVSEHFDRVGPPMLTLVLSFTLLANLLRAVARHMFAERTYIGDAAVGGVPSIFWSAGGALVVLGALVVTLPGLMARSREAEVARASLAQPFLDGERRAASRGPLRPKLLYANERTFVHWSHICTLVASTAMTITASPKLSSRALGDEADGGSTGIVVGGLLTITALALLAYAHRTYFWRASAIQYQSDRRCDDPTGPPALAAALLFAIIAAALALALPALQGATTA